MQHEILMALVVLMVTAAAGCTGEDTESSKTTIGSEIIQNTDKNATTIIKEPENKSQIRTSQNKYDTSGYCNYVVDGDTINVEGIGRIRFVGVNTPERGEVGYTEAKNFVKQKCLGKTVYLDIDDDKHYDKYGRTLAVVYVNGTNLNAELLQKGYAEIMYIPPSEFDPYSWT